MPNPREKAEQLVERFSSHVQLWDCYNDVPEEENHAVKCALICVEEIFKLSEGINVSQVWLKNQKEYKYWVEVRKILEEYDRNK